MAIMNTNDLMRYLARARTLEKSELSLRFLKFLSGVSRQGNARFGNHLYWFSWESDDSQLKNAKWDWFNARNYCRKRCMDLVAIETQQEYDFLKSHIGGAKYFWTSGRLCDFDGCDAPRFFPKNVNGWFWSSNQAKMSPTNGNGFHDWSPTGG